MTFIFKALSLLYPWKNGVLDFRSMLKCISDILLKIFYPSNHYLNIEIKTTNEFVKGAQVKNKT